MKLSDLTAEARIADILDAQAELAEARRILDDHLNMVVWYSREGVQFVGTRAEHNAFVLSGE